MPVVLVAVPAEVILSLALLLILYAFRATFAKAFAWALGYVPIIGGQLGGFLTSGVDQVIAWAQSWAKSGLDALVQIVNVPVSWATWLIQEAIGLAQGIVANLATLFAQLAAEAATRAAAVVALATHLDVEAAQLLRLAESIADQVRSIAAPLIDAALAPVRALVAAVSSALQSGIAAVRAWVAAELAQVTASLAAQVAGLQAALTAAVGALGAQLGHDVQAIDGELSQVWGAVTPLLALLPLAAAVPTITELVDITESCIIPNCKVQTPQLPILQLLADGATLALIGGLVGEAMANPEEAAKVTAGVVGGIEGAASDLFRLFTGQAA